MPPTPTTTTTRAAIYLRISLDRQEGAGVKRQEDDCRALVGAQTGWEVAGVYRDNSVSAHSGKPRPQYERLLADIRAGQIDAVVAWDPDRLHRRPLELNEYIDLAETHRVATRTVNAGHWDLSTPAGRVQARIMGDLAAYESEHKAERVTAAQLHATRAGKAVKRPNRPFGYARDWTTVVTEEAQLIQGAAARVLAGDSLYSIARDWTAAGVVGTNGKPMAATAVRAILTNPRQAGIVTWNGEVLEGVTAEWTPNLDRDTWDRVNQILTNPDRRMSTTGPKPRHLGTGVFVCDCCGASFRAYNRPSTSGTIRYYYVRGRGPGHATARGDELDEYVRDLVLTYLERTDIPRRLAELANDGDDDTHARLLVERDGVMDRLLHLETRWSDGAVTDSQFDRMNAGLQSKLADIEQRLQDTAAPDTLLAELAHVDVWDWWEEASLERRRQLIRDTVDIRVIPDRRRRQFYPDTVIPDWKF